MFLAAASAIAFAAPVAAQEVPVEDDELLNLVIPRPEEFAYAEERRLFYVALTRASRGSFLLVNNRQPSRYIRELVEIGGMRSVSIRLMASQSIIVRNVLSVSS